MSHDILQLNPLNRYDFDQIAATFAAAMIIGVIWGVLKLRPRMVVATAIAFAIIQYQPRNFWLTIGFGLFLLATTIRPSRYKYVSRLTMWQGMLVQATTGLFLISFGTRELSRQSGGIWSTIDDHLWLADSILLMFTALAMLLFGLRQIGQQWSDDHNFNKKLKTFKS